MRAGEDDTRQAIRQQYADDFALSEKLLELAYELHRRLCAWDVPPSQKLSKAVAVGLSMKISKQYRSILVLCELGLVEDAQVIGRSLFESTVQTVFVLKRHIRLRAGWKKAPPRPPRGFSAEFRAKLYLAHDVLNQHKRINVWQGKRGLKRPTRQIVEPVADMVKTIERWLGPLWTQWLRGDASKAAFRVENMAANAGLGRWYDAAYRHQSPIAHATDALAHLRPEPGYEPMVDAELRPDIDRASEPLRFADRMGLLATHAIDARFRLGLDKELVDLAARIRALMAKA